MTNSRIEVNVFDGSGDFSLWKVRMMAHFGVLGLKSILTDDKLLRNPAPTKEEIEAAKKDPQKGIEGVPDLDPSIDPAKFEKSEKAKDLIVLNVGDQVLRKISNCETAAEMWSTLNKLYMETSLPNRIYLQLKFYTFKMNDAKSIDENVDDFLKLVADLNNLGVEVSEEVQAILLLSSLPYKYDQLKETLKYGRDILRLNEVTAAAKSKERELLESGRASNSPGEGLYVESRGRSKNQQGKGRSRGRGRGRAQSRPMYDQSDTGCFICGSEDHWKRDCPEMKTKKPTESASFATEIKQPIVLTVSTQNSKKEWVMDSGCTFHSTSDREVLFDFKELDGGKVLMANNTQGYIKGTGKIRIRNQDGSEVILKDVKYMPEVSKNLISYGMLEQSGCRYEGRNFNICFYKDNKKVITGKYHKGLYYLQGAVARSEQIVSKDEEMSTKALEAEQGLRKRKSDRVTFRDNLVQGPTRHGFKGKGSSIQGGESGCVKEDSRFVAYALNATRGIDAEPKTSQEARKSKVKKQGIIAKEQQKHAGKKWVVKSKPGLLEAVTEQRINARLVVKRVSQMELMRALVSKEAINSTRRNPAKVEREEKLLLRCELPNLH